MCLLFLGNCLKIVLQINTIIIQFEVNSDINTVVRFYIELTLSVVIITLILNKQQPVVIITLILNK